MSDTLKIALVAEGITDYEVLNAAIESMLNGRSFDLKLLQPEGSNAFRVNRLNTFHRIYYKVQAALNHT
jgi:hypothetical protein